MRLFPASKSAKPSTALPALNRWPATFVAALLLAACTLTAHAGCAEGPGDAITAARARYAGDGLRFEVLRNGHRVGEHTVRFRNEDGALRVDSSMELRLKLWFIEAYHFRYRSTETWCGGRLATLEASTDDNGTVTRVSARHNPSGLVLSFAGHSTPIGHGVYPTTHWNRAALDGAEVLNTVTGQLNRIRVRPCQETIPGLPKTACREFTGDLQARVWYDDAERWHALAFDGRDGSRIEYRLAHDRADP